MFKEGMRIEMIETCKDNPNIKEGWRGTIEFINYDGSLSVEFDHFVTGNGISGNENNTSQWYVSPKQIEVIQ
jgi:hypothetical protein